MNDARQHPVASERAALAVAAAAFGALLLLPVGRSSEAMLLLVAIAGLAGVVRWRAQLMRLPVVPLVLAVFLCFWLPALCSAPDAVAAGKAWSTVLADLRFAPFALGLCLALHGRSALHARLLRWCAVLVLLWTLDALVQAVTGHSLGGAHERDRLSGVFGDGNLKLGPVLAVLSPLPLLATLRRYGRRACGLVWLALALAVLLAGARAGWLEFALVSVMLIPRLKLQPRQILLWGGLVVAATGALVQYSYDLSPRFAARVDRTLALGSADTRGVDYALAGRLPIFHTAVAMALAHPVNGIGVRGFRHAYAQYAAPGDPWVNHSTGIGAAHPHQIVLELLAETGVFGLLCWLTGAVLLLRAYRAQPAAVRERAAPAAVALFVMTFPLNTHYAFYSSFWGLLFWWLLALLLAAFAAGDDAPP